MNTSDAPRAESTKAGAATKAAPDLRVGDVDGSALAAAAGVPDPLFLQRMANEFFSAASGQEPELAMAQSSVEELQLPATVPISEAQLASIADSLSPAASAQSSTAAPILRTLSAPAGAIPSSGAAAMPQSIPPLVPQSVSPSIPASIPASIPGGFSLGQLSAEPSLGFLQEARSLFASVPAVPVNAIPVPAPAVREDEFARVIPSIPQAAIPAIPGISSELTAPQVPSATIPAAVPQDLKQYDNFLRDLTPLDPLGVMPSVSPVNSELTPLATPIGLSSIGFDVNAIRRDFPILSERVNGRQLIWLDNAATTQKPLAVIERLSRFYSHENSNIHRAAHTLAARSTDAYEAGRESVRRFLNAGSAGEIIFVRGATEAINLVAQSWGRRNIQKDDEIIVSHLEHHANIVPWQMLCAEKGARLRVAPVDNTGQVILEEYERLFSPKTKLASFAQVSNALGTITPAAEMVEIAHRHGALALVDGAQAVSHMPVDVQLLDCDFYVFSGHKIFAPTGIGVVFGKQQILANTPPWQGGGNMIADVTFEKTLYQPPPGRFEAGTGNIADAVGLGAALDYVQRIGLPNIARYEHDLLVYGTEALQRIPGLHLIGTAKEKASVLSFVLDGFRTEDVGTYLNQYGIAVRAGHHCAQPILRRFGVESTVRPSLAFYNTCEEIDALVAALWNLKAGAAPSMI